MTTATATVGSSKRLTFTFTDIAGDPAEPTSIALTIREPDGVEIAKTDADMTHAVTSPVNGTYTYDHPVAKEGRHFVHVDADGAVEAASQSEFYAFRKVTS
ncbi:MAG TPA: hypothetical protein VGA50_04585 [Kiloniellales bacterium]